MKYYLVILVLLLIGICTLYKIQNTHSIHYLIDNYSSLPSVSDTENVVISFPIYNEKESVCLLKSLVDQSVKVNEIIGVTMPKVYIDEKSIVRDIAKIVPTYVDAGNISPVIVNLIREKNCDTVLIVLRSDRKYSRDFIQNLYKLHLANPNTMLYSDDFILTSPNMFGCVLNEDLKYDFQWLLENVKSYKKVV